MATFTGKLNANEVIGALWNQIISQYVFADNVSGLSSELVDACRVDGSMYGDTKLYIATDALHTHEWGMDAEAGNLLAVKRPPAPKTQSLEIDTFRQIDVTIDNYMTKRAFMNDSIFSEFNSVVLGWLGDGKKIYDTTTFNTFVGTHTATGAKQNVNITLPVVTGDNETTNRLQAQTIAQAVADILVDVKDVSRDYNDNGFMRAFNPEDMVLVWNSAVYNKITKLDLPTIFHNQGLFGDIKQYVVNKKYFGTAGAITGDGATVRTLEEATIAGNDYFAGELVPDGEDVDAGYTENPNIACKIMHKNSVPYMSGFEVGTSFFNPKSLTENHYYTFGRNSLEHIANYPFITITATPAT